MRGWSSFLGCSRSLLQKLTDRDSKNKEDAQQDVLKMADAERKVFATPDRRAPQALVQNRDEKDTKDAAENRPASALHTGSTEHNGDDDVEFEPGKRACANR